LPEKVLVTAERGMERFVAQTRELGNSKIVILGLVPRTPRPAFT
jgi:hypothetical protein